LGGGEVKSKYLPRDSSRREGQDLFEFWGQGGEDFREKEGGIPYSVIGRKREKREGKNGEKRESFCLEVKKNLGLPQKKRRQRGKKTI